MTKVAQINDVNEVIVKWPRLLAIAQKESKVTSETLLQMFLRCLDNGAVFLVYGDSGLMGACCVENCNEYVSLLSLPRDHGVGMAKECLGVVYDWAREMGIDEVRVTTTQMCGSNFKYFQKSLGFSRHSVTFKRSI